MKYRTRTFYSETQKAMMCGIGGGKARRYTVLPSSLTAAC